MQVFRWFWAITFAFACTLLMWGSSGSGAHAEDTHKKKEPVREEVAPVDQHRQYFKGLLQSNGKSVAKCFSCHAKTAAGEAGRAERIVELKAELARLLTEDPRYTADVKIEAADGYVVATPQFLIKAGTAATVSFQDRKIDYTIQVEAAKQDHRHQVEICVFTEAADGTRNYLSQLSVVVPTAKEYRGEVNGYKFSLKINALK